MKKSEIVLWIIVAVAMAAVLYLQRHPGYSWARDLSQRYAVDFDQTQTQVIDYIKQWIPDVTDSQIEEWTASGKLESMTIGRRTMYFRNAGPNLFRIVPELSAIKDASENQSQQDVSKTGAPLKGHEAVDAQTVPIIKERVSSNLAAFELKSDSSLLGSSSPDSLFIALPKRMRVTFSLTVPANTLRPGKTLRCWLPFPRSDVSRQTGVKLIEAGVDSVAYPVEKITFSAPSCPHSSLYMEAKVKREKPTTFYEVFEYVSSGEWHPIDSTLVLPYDTDSPEYKNFTSEREKHVIFTPRVRAIADSLTAGIENPYSQAKAIFTWIDNNFPWASAREYSTIENIPEYVLASGHGDCGQVTLLFMTLCRAKGIPVRWQSGLMTHPGARNLHDWCEAYFEGCGWVPVDQSFGITSYGGYFFLGGIDPYRMIVNTDFGGALDPAKKFPGSDTVDFQRGEVEWDRGNLYYNQWDYNFKIEYL